MAEQNIPVCGKRKYWAATSTKLLNELPQHNMVNMEEKQPIPIVCPVKGSDRLRSSCLVDAPPRKFLPKYGEAKGELYSLKHAPVFITSASLLTQVYIRILDGDYFRYRKLITELQDEFRSASSKCASFWPSPVFGNLIDLNNALIILFSFNFFYLGHVYAAKLGIYWSRVLIEEMEDKRKVVYQVDKGHRRIVLPSMVFHLLPDRY